MPHPHPQQRRDGPSEAGSVSAIQSASGIAETTATDLGHLALGLGLFAACASRDLSQLAYGAIAYGLLTAQPLLTTGHPPERAPQENP